MATRLTARIRRQIQNNVMRGNPGVSGNARRKLVKAVIRKKKLRPALPRDPKIKSVGPTRYKGFYKQAIMAMKPGYRTAANALKNQRPGIRKRYQGLMGDLGLQEGRDRTAIGKESKTALGSIQSRAARAGVFRSSDETGQELASVES